MKEFFLHCAASVLALALTLVCQTLQAQQSDADVKKLAELRVKAEKGDAQAQCEYGLMFFEGKLGATKDAAEAVKWFRKAAEQNNADAQNNLGECYAKGKGVGEDAAEAAKVTIVNKAGAKLPEEMQADLQAMAARITKQKRELPAKAEQGDAPSQCELGQAYLRGNKLVGKGVTKDAAEAVKWFRKAAEQNHAYGQLYLGQCYAKGEGVTRDAAEAANWYRKAAEQNNVLAQLNLGECYAKGEGVAKDAAEAAKWYRKAAEQNNTLAQLNLGECYAKGEGVTKDAAEACKWANLAAKWGNEKVRQSRDALVKKMTRKQIEEGKRREEEWQQQYGRKQADLRAEARQNGAALKGELGVDYAEAVKWYRKAAEQNHAEAQYNLGTCYGHGQGVTRDAAEAANWYRKAAEQNHTVAQYKLGDCYVIGLGVTKDLVVAVSWYRKAAEQNYVLAQDVMGVRYFKGEGVPKDYAEAVKWFRRAAEQNDAGSQYKLGLCYESGYGVPTDKIEACKWYLLAMARGENAAKTNLAMLKGEMSPFPNEEVLRRASEWTKQHMKTSAE